MATPTDAELLASAKTAISMIMAGAQEYQMSLPGGGTRMVKRANLKELQVYVNDMERKLAAVSGSPIATLFVRMK